MVVHYARTRTLIFTWNSLILNLLFVGTVNADLLVDMFGGTVVVIVGKVSVEQ
jgi:hypothetical protein